MDIYLSTIGKNAAALAREYGFGIEIAEFSCAVNMDEDFERWDELTRGNLSGIKNRIFHAPFNELCPAAIDPLIARVTKGRLEQAYRLMRRYEINKMIVHSGYIPNLYFRDWFAERSSVFWRDFLSDKPADFSLFLENVLEEDPEMLISIIEKTNDERFRLCLDIGHAGGRASILPVSEWIDVSAPYLKHVHVHNNDHKSDLHDPPGKGLIDMKAAITRITDLRPDTSYTLETEDLSAAIAWLKTYK